MVKIQENFPTRCALIDIRGLQDGNGTRSFDSRPAGAFRAQSWNPYGFSNTDEESSKVVSVVPLIGRMSKYGTWYSYGATEIAGSLMEAAADGNVIGVVLDIDSAGGYVNAIAPLVEAINAVREAGKPIVAHADDCYSAAYWVASQCDAVFLDNPLSGCGSIGAFMELFDDREDKLTGFRYITIYAPESKDKNLAERNALDGKPEVMEKELSALVRMFQDAVKLHRPALKADTPGVMSGARFLTAEAIAAGLCDGMMTLRETVEAVAVRSEFK